MIRRRIAVLLVALLAATGLVSSPAEARWGYCNPHTIITGAVNLYDNQGYCGGHTQVFQQGTGACSPIPAAYNNWAGSVDNAASIAVRLFDGPSCTGSSFYRASYTAHPDLFAVGFNGVFSSMRWGG